MSLIKFGVSILADILTEGCAQLIAEFSAGCQLCCHTLVAIICSAAIRIGTGNDRQRSVAVCEEACCSLAAETALLLMASYKFKVTAGETIIHPGISVMFTYNGTATQIGGALYVSVLNSQILDVPSDQAREESSFAVGLHENVTNHMIVTIESAPIRC